jgi:hypothetical protein
MYSAVAVCVLLVVATGARRSTASATSPPLVNPQGQMVLLTLESSAGFVSSDAASGEMLLDTSGWRTALVKLGPSGCANGALFGAGQSEAEPAAVDSFPDAAAVWTISARLVSSEEDRATVDLRWHRAVRQPGLVPAESIDAAQRVELRVGRRGVLDLVKGDLRRGACDSFAILLGLKMRPWFAVSDGAISYDLWLVQHQVDGQETIDRFTTRGRQGGDARFFFRTLDYTAAGVHLDNPATADLRQYISGTVTGTLFDSDRIDLTIDVSQNVGHAGGTVGSGGRKRLTVQNGETVQFDLPSSPTGHISKYGDVGQIFKGQRTAIRLTPRVLWKRAD